MSAAAFILDFPAQADEVLREQLERCRPAAVGKAIREDVVTEVKTHLARLDKERANDTGGRRTHFYEKAADSVDHVLTDQELRIQIPHLGLAQRFFGGPITPQSREWLTIPARAETYGHRAGEFQNLQFIRFSADSAALVKTAGFTRTEHVDDAGNVTLGTRRNRSLKDEGLVMFWLTREVFQAPDPTVLPTPARIAEVALESAQTYVEGFRQ